MFISKGGGNTVTIENSKERIDFQINGSKWWVISMAGLVDAWNCKAYTKGKNLDPFWYAASWFNYVQPQLALTRFYGCNVFMTIQNPGEIIYVPSHCKYSNYAVEDSFSFAKLMQTSG